MAKKEQTFRGKTLEELKQLEIREFAKFLKSRPRRVLLKHFQDIHNFVKKCNKKVEKKKSIKTHKRDIIIVPQLIDKRILVHNGKEFVPVDITLEMLGHRLGEFAHTRGKVTHGAPGIGATRSSASASVK